MRRTPIARLRLPCLAVLAGVSACSTTDLAEPGPQVATGARAGQCPEPRATPRAPDSYYARVNPLPATAVNVERGRTLYLQETRQGSCASCHGAAGDGLGPAGRGLDPPPRNFTCAETMAGVPDGQLHWVIESGSGEYHAPSGQGAQRVERPGRGGPPTAMRGYGNILSSTETWQLVLYIRSHHRGGATGQP